MNKEEYRKIIGMIDNALMDEPTNIDIHIYSYNDGPYFTIKLLKDAKHE